MKADDVNSMFCVKREILRNNTIHSGCRLPILKGVLLCVDEMSSLEAETFSERH